MSRILTHTTVSIAGIGLITGLPVNVEVQQAPIGSGINFYVDDEDKTRLLPARLDSVIHTDRGITLRAAQAENPSLQTPALSPTLSIVEHFLCACALLGLNDLSIRVQGAPELPFLDGSAMQWVKALRPLAPSSVIKPEIPLKYPLSYHHAYGIYLMAIPSETFQITYAVNFDHPDLRNRWVHWSYSSPDDIEQIAPARTFGFVSELPALQAKGLARGVTMENTLGLTDEGGYTDLLRLTDEPVRHKIVDLMGDLMLTGMNPLRLKAHIFAFQAGHTSHIVFARMLMEHCCPKIPGPSILNP